MLTLAPLSEQSLPQILEWVRNPAIAEPLDLIKPHHPSEWLDGYVRSYGVDGNPYIDRVFLMEVIRDSELVGFVISYGWDTVDDTIREIDLALPGLGSGRAVLEVIMRTIHHCFQNGASRVRGRLRPGASGAGFARLFASMGAKEVAQPQQLNPRRRVAERRVLYNVSPKKFYASRGAQRFGLTWEG